MGYVGNTSTANYTSFDKQDLTGVTGSPAKRGFTLSHSVANANEIAVYVNNVRQEPTDAYTVNGTGLTMTGDVETSDDFYVIFLGKAIQTTVPPDGSVSTAKIANSAVNLTSKVTGILPVANGGTGASSFNAGFTAGSTLTPSAATTQELSLPIASPKMFTVAISDIYSPGNGWITCQLGHSSGTYPDGGYDGSIYYSTGNSHYQNNGPGTSQLNDAHGLTYYGSANYFGVINCYLVDASVNEWVISSSLSTNISTAHRGQSDSHVELGAGNTVTKIKFISHTGSNLTTLKVRIFAQ